MPQFTRRPGQERDPAQRQADNLAAVRRGVDVGREHVSVKEQLDRLGRDEIRKIGQQIAPDKPGWPSDRTLRRWAKDNRVPHADLAARIKRADQVTRLGGDKEAAQKAGRSVATIKKWKADPDRKMKGDAETKFAQADRADRLSAAGIPNKNGRLLKPAKIYAQGDVWVKGTASSPTYERGRTLDGIALDMEATERMVQAQEAGDEAGALAAVEEYLSKNYAACEEYDDASGWHFDGLGHFDVRW